ncbi:conserved hypothetical protein [Halopseudomonas xinjiangensis]|uniref:Calcium/calmodulin-dependent protein kinase II association-domain domain-containing protein n=1 Tax=Halopseudomonas xinjiangensis TaxID=487184 RepID=A0A1H1RCU5_9GAMM|nr:DUF4440 domain-containing protein [Halopseudomonas xinjiangensis]SDS33540.1 conserved hypothetical protein [Halopseudomonas xinjiangensis]
MKNTIVVLIGSAVLAGCAAQSPSVPPSARSEQCQPIDENGVMQLFDRWNRSLLTGDPEKVVANYARNSILLPTLSDKPRFTPEEKLEYFQHFLGNQPSGEITLRAVELGCNTVVDSGLYTFTFARTGSTAEARYTYTYRWDGQQWLITSHHSSLMPETSAQQTSR